MSLLIIVFTYKVLVLGHQPKQVKLYQQFNIQAEHVK